MSLFLRPVIKLVTLLFVCLLFVSPRASADSSLPTGKDPAREATGRKRPGVLKPGPRTTLLAVAPLPYRPLPIFAVHPTPKTPRTLDPIRFQMVASKAQVQLGEEFEITISADLLPILSSQMFFFESQRAFSLKVLVPDGFEQTGGDYYDYMGTELQASGKTTVTYTLRGQLTKAAKAATFALLRGPKDASATSYFERKQTLVISLNDTVANPAQARQASAVDTACHLPNASIAIQYTSVTQKAGPVIQINIFVNDSLGTYEYSADSTTFNAANVVTPTHQQGFLFIRATNQPACFRKIPYNLTEFTNSGSTTTYSDCTTGKHLNLGANVSTICPTTTLPNQAKRQARAAASSAILSVVGCSPGVTWYKNGATLSSVGSGTSITVTDQGTYFAKCRPTDPNCDPNVYINSNEEIITIDCTDTTPPSALPVNS